MQIAKMEFKRLCIDVVTESHLNESVSVRLLMSTGFGDIRIGKVRTSNDSFCKVCLNPTSSLILQPILFKSSLIATSLLQPNCVFK